ncbi:MAG: sigma-70 family RNA polymerase sigma factor [Kiritimatiellia bacterium]
MPRPVPKTSITLLNALKADSGSARWAEFLRVYETPMRAFLAARYPTVDADDVLQEALLALMKCLPDYHYAPDEKGCFHNYLMGILKFKALDAIRKNERKQATLAGLRNGAAPAAPSADDAELEEWKNHVMEAALQQVLSDASIDSRKREIFRAVALDRERPEAVARRYGTTRGNVDVIKNRIVRRLHEIAVALMEAADR